MTRTYVIPDLHGRIDLLSSAWERIMGHSPLGGTIITIGDYIDRGPYSRAVLDWLIHVRTGNFRLFCLRGNHEQMMLDALSGLYPNKHPGLWIGNGGDATLASYGHPWPIEYATISFDVIPPTHIAWLNSLRLYHTDAHRVYVHAGVLADHPLTAQPPQTTLWHRYDFGDEGGYSDRHVVHGHTPHRQPELKKGRTNLDTEAWKTGRLVVGVFEDDKPGGPVELIDVDGAPYGRSIYL